MAYNSLESIPIHAFTNRQCTESPNKELLKYLRYMLDNHPYDLAYLWRYTQQYVNHGGCYVMYFDFWRNKLDNDLTKQGFPPTKVKSKEKEK